MRKPATSRAGLSENHARALVEVLEALAPDYRPGLRWDAQLWHALFGVPALLSRPRPQREAAHQAAEAFISARRAGIYLARIPHEALQGLITGLEFAASHAKPVR